jgi:hypothetical protein
MITVGKRQSLKNTIYLGIIDSILEFSFYEGDS